ncbi:MAG: HDIG domain-containing metalloprotein [Candidatus Moraniibacteriota bacterium]
MSKNQEKLDSFKKIVIENCSKSDFKYREWFVKDHLMIVQRIALELCDMHPEADRELVSVLVWFHDFGKSIDEKNEYELTKTKGVETLRALGFEEKFIQRVLEAWERMEKKNEIDIAKESIEVQIISSSDGASHFVGKFHATYFQDDPQESIDLLEKRIKEKIIKDWERKIVLPEVKKAFEVRYLRSLEIVGEYPEKFIG